MMQRPWSTRIRFFFLLFAALTVVEAPGDKSLEHKHLYMKRHNFICRLSKKKKKVPS